MPMGNDGLSLETVRSLRRVPSSQPVRSPGVSKSQRFRKLRRPASHAIGGSGRHHCARRSVTHKLVGPSAPERLTPSSETNIGFEWRTAHEVWLSLILTSIRHHVDGCIRLAAPCRRGDRAYDFGRVFAEVRALPPANPPTGQEASSRLLDGLPARSAGTRVSGR